MFEVKRYRGLVMFDGNIDAKSERKPTCAFKNCMRTLANFHRLRNSNFIWESKMVEVNQKQNWKQPDWLDAVWKFYFTLEIN